jgi:hypothetical protein
MKKPLLIRATAILIGVVTAFALVELLLRIQPFVEIDGHTEQSPWHSVLHHGSDEFGILDHGCGSNTDENITRVLLLGDSWMEDPILSSTLGQEIAKRTGNCVRTFNGGVSSYSPILYMLKGRAAGYRWPG